jgi:hypothetical protein
MISRESSVCYGIFGIRGSNGGSKISQPGDQVVDHLALRPVSSSDHGAVVNLQDSVRSQQWILFQNCVC